MVEAYAYLVRLGVTHVPMVAPGPAIRRVYRRRAVHWMQVMCRELQRLFHARQAPRGTRSLGRRESIEEKMNKGEKQCINDLKEIIKLIKNKQVSITSIEIENDVEKLAIPGTTIMSPEYTGNHILTVRWIDK